MCCKDYFHPPLHLKTNISEYSEKLFRLSTRFEAWHHSDLVGLVAAYCNENTGRRIFISNVSTLPQFTGKGIAKTLMTHCIEYGINNKFSCIDLEVSSRNIAAITLYEKLGFKLLGKKSESLEMRLSLTNKKTKHEREKL